MNANKKKLLGDNSPWVSHVSGSLFNDFCRANSLGRWRQCPLEARADSLLPRMKDPGSLPKLRSPLLQCNLLSVQIPPSPSHNTLGRWWRKEHKKMLISLAIAISSDIRSPLFDSGFCQNPSNWQANLSGFRKAKTSGPSVLNKH